MHPTQKVAPQSKPSDKSSNIGSAQDQEYEGHAHPMQHLGLSPGYNEIIFSLCGEVGTLFQSIQGNVRVCGITSPSDALAM